MILKVFPNLSDSMILRRLVFQEWSKGSPSEHDWNREILKKTQRFLSRTKVCKGCRNWVTIWILAQTQLLEARDHCSPFAWRKIKTCVLLATVGIRSPVPATSSQCAGGRWSQGSCPAPCKGRGGWQACEGWHNRQCCRGLPAAPEGRDPSEADCWDERQEEGKVKIWHRERKSSERESQALVVLLTGELHVTALRALAALSHPHEAHPKPCPWPRTWSQLPGASSPCPREAVRCHWPVLHPPSREKSQAMGCGEVLKNSQWWQRWSQENHSQQSGGGLSKKQEVCVASLVPLPTTVVPRWPGAAPTSSFSLSSVGGRRPWWRTHHLSIRLG